MSFTEINIKSYPIKTIDIDQAISLQHKLVDAITNEFDGFEILNTGDLGINPKNNQPIATGKVEKVLANFFECDDAVFIRGSGTGAIREGLASILEPGDKLLVHTSEIYSTTQTTIKLSGYKVERANFNCLEEIKEVLEEKDIKACLIQFSRQEICDSYDINDVIKTIKHINPKIKILTDDNYVVMKVLNIGSQLGADISCFSLFKLLGPEGVGLAVGNKTEIEKIRKFHYSGGSQVQGFEAMDALRSLVLAPVQLAIQSRQIDLLNEEINKGSIPGVKGSLVANAQSKVLLVEFEEKIAKEVLKQASILGAAAYPIGSESKYEIVPMFYRLSGTMRKSNQRFEDYWIRINPMKAGKETVLRILKESIKRAKDVS